MVNNQNDHENKDILFHSLSTLWLEETKMKVKESTHVKYTNLLKWYINPQLGSYFLVTKSTPLAIMVEAAL